MTPLLRLIPLIAGSSLMALSVSAAASPSAADEALFERLDANKDGKISDGEVSSEHRRLFARLVRNGDADGDESLSRDEFIVALVPRRPEKELEEKLPTENPQADAVRWLLLSMDASGNSAIEEDEVPERFERVFDNMLRRIDGDKNGVVSRRELYQGGRQLAQIAGRYVESEGIDVKAELKRLDKKLGPAAQRFDVPSPRLDDLGDPEKARQVFAQLDGNGSGHIEKGEIPEQLQRPFERLMRRADRDGDGRLSEQEFLGAARQMGRRQGRRNVRPAQAFDSKSDDSMPAGEAMPADGE